MTSHKSVNLSVTYGRCHRTKFNDLLRGSPSVYSCSLSTRTSNSHEETSFGELLYDSSYFVLFIMRDSYC